MNLIFKMGNLRLKHFIDAISPWRTDAHLEIIFFCLFYLVKCFNLLLGNILPLVDDAKVWCSREENWASDE